MSLRIPLDPPRRYGLRDAYHGRVWRSRWACIGREVLTLGAGASLVGLLYEEWDLVTLGVLLCALGLAVAVAGSLVSNARRVAVIRRGPRVPGEIGRARRVILLHEFFRGERARTFRLTFYFTDAGGRRRHGCVLICGCARKYLPEGSAESVVFDPDRPARCLPLRVAVMVMPG